MRRQGAGPTAAAARPAAARGAGAGRRQGPVRPVLDGRARCASQAPAGPV